nr:hypothetical protein [Nakamurella antarctica]
MRVAKRGTIEAAKITRTAKGAAMSKRGRKRKSRKKGGANHGKRPNA